MKTTLVVILALTLSLTASAQTVCTLQPGAASVCTLPAITADQCVAYHFLWSYQDGISSSTVTLNSSVAFTQPSTAAQNQNQPDIYEMKGEFCGNSYELILGSPVVQNEQLITQPQTGVMTEDLSVPSTLELVLHGQRGFGNPAFLGGTVSIH